MSTRMIPSRASRARVGLAVAGFLVSLSSPVVWAQGGIGLRSPWLNLDVQWGDRSPINAPYVVETRGPVHEAFAEPILFEPTPGFVIPQRPPEPLNEIPPEIYPTVSTGGQISWVPGYWAWDDERNSFLWLSGLWRNMPPGRQFIPGYWLELTTGFQWVSGFWLEEGATTVQYLPQPPESLERGPEGDPPGLGYLWVPGTWLWKDVGYLWRPGFWMPANENWDWIPDHYVWAPGGYIFVNGYWDYPLSRRGLLFAPVYVPTPVAAPPAFVYQPSVVINVSMLIGDLFTRPRYSHYYFGDYYERQYFRSGIYPAYAFAQSDYGYDPVFANYVALQRVPRAQVIQRFRDDYRYLRDHPNVRPPRTYAGFRELRSRRDLDPQLAGRVRLVEPLSQLAQAGGRDAPFRFERLDGNRLDRYRRMIGEARDYRRDRERMEIQQVRPSRGGPVDPSDLVVPSGRVRDTGPTAGRSGEPSITRSPIQAPDRPTPQRGTVERSTPERPTRPSGNESTTRGRERERADTSIRRGDNGSAAGRSGTGAPSISRQQLSDDARRSLRSGGAPGQLRLRRSPLAADSADAVARPDVQREGTPRDRSDARSRRVSPPPAPRRSDGETGPSIQRAPRERRAPREED